MHVFESFWEHFLKGLGLNTLNLLLFSGEARDIMLRQSRLAQFCSDLAAKALLLVPPTELEIFYSDLAAKALLLVIPTVLEIIHQNN